MRQNYRGNKKRIEETKKKRKEAKLNKRLGKKEEVPGQDASAPAATPEAAA